MAQVQSSGELLEFIAALIRLTQKFPEAPRKEDCLGGFPGYHASSRTELEWCMRMELVGYYTIGKLERLRFKRVVEELESNHPNLIDAHFNEAVYVFVLDSEELPSYLKPI